MFNLSYETNKSWPLTFWGGVTYFGVDLLPWLTVEIREVSKIMKKLFMCVCLPCLCTLNLIRLVIKLWGEPQKQRGPSWLKFEMSHLTITEALMELHSAHFEKSIGFSLLSVQFNECMTDGKSDKSGGNISWLKPRYRLLHLLSQNELVIGLSCPVTSTQN